MNRKIKLCLLPFFALFFVQQLNAQSLSELRDRYMVGLHNLDSTPQVYHLFQHLKNPTAKSICYKGALQAIMTKTTWNIFKKMTFLRESEASFKLAVKKAPEDIEIRFMRMAVQFEIPEYLGFSENMDEDSKFIIENIEDFDTSELPQQTINEILRFMKRCDRFSDAQIHKFEKILAVN